MKYWYFEKILSSRKERRALVTTARYASLTVSKVRSVYVNNKFNVQDEMYGIGQVRTVWPSKPTKHMVLTNDV